MLKVYLQNGHIKGVEGVHNNTLQQNDNSQASK